MGRQPHENRHGLFGNSIREVFQRSMLGSPVSSSHLLLER